MVYKPVNSCAGGRQYISIPVLFLINASSHFDVGRALVGDPAKVWWLTVFGISGLVVLLEIMVSKHFLPPAGVDGDPEAEPSLTFKVVRAAFAHFGLRVAVYIFSIKCLKIDLTSFL
jgi:hypothetical protein